MAGGESTRRAQCGVKKPNWKEWRHIPSVRAWEACALSLDIEPRAMEQLSEGWMAGPGAGPFFTDESFPDAVTAEEFRSRLRVLLANLYDRGHFSADAIHLVTPGFNKVKLCEFAAWAANVVQWEGLPSELSDLQDVGGAAGAQAAANVKAKPETPSEKTASASTRTVTVQSRRSELAAEIKVAKSKATDQADYHSVWNVLREMALAGTPPFTGDVSGGRLAYTNINGKLAHFTKNALRNRMARAARQRSPALTSAR